MTRLVVSARLASSSYRTYAEYLRHPVFRACVKARLMICGGKCEKCETETKLEPHHVLYPAWGAFDTPSNIRMICHACHCMEHNKAA